MASQVRKHVFQSPSPSHEKQALTTWQSIEEKLNDDRIRAGLDTIRRKCRVRALSVGVVHEGKVVLDMHVGSGKNDSDQPPDWGSLYTMSSLSKVFVSAAFGILVGDGKIKWSDKVKDYIPSFNPSNDEAVRNATFIEVLRLTSGLSNPVVSMLGPFGKVIVPEEDFMNLINATPTSREGISLYNQLEYSNVAYGLVALAIERVSGQKYAAFVTERILDPLGMENTALSASQVAKISNVASSYAQMSNGKWHKLNHEWTRDDNSPVLGMVGVRSSVKDMLILISAMMDAYDRDAPQTSKDRLRQSCYNDQYNHSVSHHLPWIRVHMPCCMLSGGYNKTLGDWVVDEDGRRRRNAQNLGQDSEKRLAFIFNGLAFCGASAVKFFPATRSIVVAFASGLNVGDAADFASLMLVQELFDLRPKIDILDMVNFEIKTQGNNFDLFKQELAQHKQAPKTKEDLAQYVGHYVGLGICLVITMNPQGSNLLICLNNITKLTFPLSPYGKDQFSYGPSSRDEWLRDGWLDWDYYRVGILTFTRDTDATFSGVEWVWERGADPYMFTKQVKVFGQNSGSLLVDWTEIENEIGEKATGPFCNGSLTDRSRKFIA